MAITTRQSSLLVAEDWTKVYQTFRDADFQSYDYETIRKSMIDYLRLYYPEDFNDFIESSEFVALIDTIAFMGQSLAFRSDLNARENFIDTAERRDSVLKLARLISYVPKRNIPASGYLKIDSVSTTEVLYDSNGLNLSGIVAEWNDTGNDNWQEQFNTILNSSLNSNQVIGKPNNSQLINGIQTDEYGINLVRGIVPTYSFDATVEGSRERFEVVSPTSVNQINVYENAPRPSAPFNVLYRKDNLGNASANTGFFLYFKQGELKQTDFSFTESVPNRVFSISSDNVNNSDVWLYKLNNASTPTTLWDKVPAVSFNNNIYNQLTNKDIYQVNTRAGDQIDLVFGDGSFANIPQGNYRLYYRTSNGVDYKITPDEMQGVVVNINYVSRNGRTETLTVRASLQYTVANASSRETVEEVRQKAPQQYYTQNRMVTGEDYNILPYTLFSNVLKVKAVNRTTSGVSRYLDVIDTTGKYSSTNIFAQDGYLYRESFAKSFSFEYENTNDIRKILYGQVADILANQETLQFFYAFYPTISITTDYRWNKSTDLSNGVTGYWDDSASTPQPVGASVSTNLKYLRVGAVVKLSAGTGKYFDNQNRIKTGTPANNGDKTYIYTSVVAVTGDGSNNGVGNLANGVGPITLAGEVPSEAKIVGIFPSFTKTLTTATINTIIDNILAVKEFALRYDVDNYEWKIITAENIKTTGEFDRSNAGNTSGNALDASWHLYFETEGQTYTVNYRGLNYAFESKQETNFYFDGDVKIYDPKTGFTVRDQIKVLKVNTNPDDTNSLGVDYTWYIYKNITEVDGYENPSKVLVTFPDANNDGFPDNPELFEILVDPDTNTDDKYIYFEDTYTYDNFVKTIPINKNDVVSEYTTLRALELNKSLYTNGQLFYLEPTNEFYSLAVSGIAEGINVATYTLTKETKYSAKLGRQDLYFQYRHNSPNYRRIDPSPNNIIDLYVLTRQYSTDHTAWIQDTSNTVTEPKVPSSQDLELEFSDLENYKSISDTIIYNSAKFKPVFGPKADPALQATFKVVKNPSLSISDNEVKTSVIAAINRYFNVDNWDFGETFYFSELSAYLHSVLAPNVSSITIVPSSSSSVFGSLLQINANFNEIITSSATVDNVDIIPAITAAQLNQVGVV